MKVSIAPEAERELNEGARYYSRESNASLGFAFITEFERSIALLREHPLLGASWRGAIRRLPLRRFPCSIVYQLQKSEVRVLAVAHQRRKPGFGQGRT